MQIRVAGATGRKVINLPLSDSELNYQMHRMGVTGLVPKCRLVSAEGADNPLSSLEGKIVNMDEVNYLAKRMESLTDYEKKVMSVYVSKSDMWEMKELINLTFSLPGLSLLTDFSDATQVGKRLYMDKELGMSESDAENINFIALADKVLHEAKVEVTPYGVFVENGFAMEETYNGVNFPAYLYDVEHTVAIVELQNHAGASEYLYLPTDHISFEKAKDRLGVTDYWECAVAGVVNVKLSDILGARPEDLKEIEQLTYFNEMCQVVQRFDNDRMKQLEMAAELVSIEDFRDITYIARNLGDFETHPGIHTEMEYGKYLVTESGLFDVDELLLPHIDYVSFAQEKINSTLAASTFLEEGFVGSLRPVSDYQNYHGEFADPLEIDEDCYQTFCLYSPLTVRHYIDGEEQGNLYRSDIIPYEEEIAEAIECDGCLEEVRGLMHYYDESAELASKVMAAHPKVREVAGELYGVLECKITEPLNAEDIEMLKEYWTGQMSDGWGEGFEQQEIRIDEGEIYVSFWNSEDFWSVMTAEELNVSQEQEIKMSF